MKLKIKSVTKKDLGETNQIRLEQAKALFQERPFVTKTWMAMYGGFPMEWLNKNWNKIIF